MEIQHLTLYTQPLEAMQSFYEHGLGLTVTQSDENSFTVQSGHTAICFTRSEGDTTPYYHYAFNIPENQVELAKAWLQERVAVLPGEEGEMIQNFANWNAHAVYFKDPAGNIVEFIARHNLDNAREDEFGPESILYLSEMGIPTKEVGAYFDQLSDALGISQFDGDMHRFNAAGSETGLFIIVNEEVKKWFPTEIPALPGPMRVQVKAPNGVFVVSTSSGPEQVLTVQASADAIAL